MKRRLLAAAIVAAVGFGWVAFGALAGGASDNKALFGSLSGKKEVNATTGEKNAGDPDGRGSATAIIDGTKFCYGLTVKGIATPVAAHVHKGSPKVAGGVVIPLTAPETSPGASSDCVDIDPALASAILKNPHKYYWNVHTGDFPGGAVRGQVFARK